MIKSIDKATAHRITSGQVVIDLQTAVKELVENSLDAGATNIEVRLKNYGLSSVEVIDNGSGIKPEDYEGVGLKHHTSKLSKFEDLESVETFGFRGEAVSSLCALSEKVIITTATAVEDPVGSVLSLDRNGKLKDIPGKAARSKGTTVIVEGLFSPLPVRRKEFQRNSKRELSKVINFMYAYGLVPCAQENKGVRFSVFHQPDGGRKTLQMRTDGVASVQASISSIWGPKQLENLVPLDLRFDYAPEKSALRRQASGDGSSAVHVRGYISKPAPGCGRSGTDRQFFYINGRPCNPSKVQKAFNEFYKSYNVFQSPFIVADFLLPPNNCDVNVSPDKRTILLHSENNLIASLMESLESTFSSTRSTFMVQSQIQTQSLITQKNSPSTNMDQGRPGNAQISDWPSNDLLSEGSTDPQGLPSEVSTEAEEDNTSVTSVDLTSDPKSSEMPRESLDTPPIHEIIQIPKPSRKATSRAFTIRIRDSDVDQEIEAVRQDTDSGSTEEIITARKSGATSSRISTRGRSPSPASLPVPRVIAKKLDSRDPTIQAVMDTTNLSWNLRRRSEEPDTTDVRKKARLDLEVPKKDDATSSRQKMRTKIQNFARSGSQLRPASPGRASDEDEEDELESDETSTPVKSRSKDRKLPTAHLPGPATSEEHKDGNQQIATARSPDIAFNVVEEVVNMMDVDPVTSKESNAPDQEDLLSEDDEGTTTVPQEVVRTIGDDGSSALMEFDLSTVEAVWSNLLTMDSNEDVEMNAQAAIGTRASVNNVEDTEGAEAELSRVIDKDDFAAMRALGQFNLGFIIARRRLRSSNSSSSNQTSKDISMDDLFIIDQHAADEKYNFENLQKKSRIESQKLFRPRTLELSAVDEMVAMDNLEILQRNGFDVTVHENDKHKLKLVAQPVSGKTSFDIKDLEELLYLLRDRPPGQMVRCSKARAMFASKACRKSVMIGTALKTSQMTDIIRHMGTMDQPWNCPHGRPTMRHLTDLNDISNRVTRRRDRSVDWSNL